MRRDRRRGRHRGRRDPRRTSSPRSRSCTPASAASCPRSPRAGISSSSRRSCARRSTEPESTLERGRPRRRHPRARADRRAARRARRRQGARLGARPAARPGRPPARPRRLALPPADRLEPPFLCLLASGGHTLLLDVAGPRRVSRARRRRSTTPPARRSTRAPACSASATRAARRSTGSPATATPRPTTFPSRGFPASTSPSPG